jgi:hypothetical protein
MPALGRWRLGLAVLALTLVGCAGPEDAPDAVKRPKSKPADEAAQAERRALRTLRAFCTGTQLALPNEVPEKVRQPAAVAAVSLLIDHARRGIRRGDDEDNVAWRTSTSRRTRKALRPSRRCKAPDAAMIAGEPLLTLG